MNNLAAITLLPLSVTIVGVVFSAMLLNRYFTGKRRLHELIWGIAFLMFAIAAASEFYSDAAGGWTPISARLFYLFGAILNVGFLGVGTVYLLFSRRVANIALAIMVVFSVVAVIVVFTVPVDPSLLHKDTGYTAVVAVSSLPRYLAGFSNAIGSILLIGGAIWSGIAFRGKPAMRHRMIGVFLIAVGALIVASGGTFVGLTGLKDFVYHSSGILVGVIVMFVGYLESIRSPLPHSQVAEQRAAATGTGAQ
jgi:hypothetical protein